jgi:hypothetical protein
MSASREVRLAVSPFELRGGINQILVPVAAGVITAQPHVTDLTLIPAGVLATLTVKFPPSPDDGDEFTITSTTSITALTLDGAGKTVLAPIGTLTSGGFVTYKYRSFGASWYRKG